MVHMQMAANFLLYGIKQTAPADEHDHNKFITFHPIEEQQTIKYLHVHWVPTTPRGLDNAHIVPII